MIINVLYLDDEPILCNIFSETFKSDKINIDTFINSKDAILAAQKNQYDIIFLDYRLPDTNGDLVAQAMPNDIPKYILTGEVSVTTHYKFQKVLRKPYDISEINKLLENRLMEHS
jgi:DNA-binding NtrC family response regulator